MKFFISKNIHNKSQMYTRIPTTQASVIKNEITAKRSGMWWWDFNKNVEE
jgi:hypothetical protein